MIRGMTLGIVIATVALAVALVAQPVRAAPTCFGRAATIVGTGDADDLVGTAASDVIVGRGGDDRIVGRGGPDYICAGGGNDAVSGGGGNDRMSGDLGTDLVSFDGAKRGVLVDLASGVATGQGSDSLSAFESVEGSALADEISGTTGPNSLLGRDGNDLIRGRAGDDFLVGGDGADRLSGGFGSDFFDAGRGNDEIAGGAGFDVLSYSFAARSVTANLATGVASGYGTDTLSSLEALIGSDFPDILTADDRGTVLIGAGGDDELIGGDGVDALEGGAGDDNLDGRDGVDVASYYTAPGGVGASLALGTVTGDGTDTLAAIEAIDGSPFNDVITGDSNTNYLFGEFGDDALDGGGGVDVAIYAFATAGVVVDLAAGTSSGDGIDTLEAIEAVDGSEFGDNISGTSSSDIVFAEAGDDIVDTKGGIDSVDGGEGTDTCLNAEDMTSCESTTAVVTTRMLVHSLATSLRHRDVAFATHGARVSRTAGSPLTSGGR